MSRLMFLLGLAFWAACAAWPQDMAELEIDHNVNAALETPHTDWATPYVGGKMRVLFFVNGRGTEAREIIELKQRFDLEPQMIFWGRIVDTTIDAWHGGELGLRRMARLLEEKWDAFVFLRIPPDKMPVAHQYVLLRAVTEGAGLVLVGTSDPRVLKEKNKLTELPPFLADVPHASAFTIKQGRGVQIAQTPQIPYAPGWDILYDEWAMRLGKAILWAARKEPSLQLSLTPLSSSLPQASLPGQAARLAWQGGGGVAQIFVRRDDGHKISLPPQKLSAPQGSLPVTLPALRAGEYHLDVIVHQGAAVASFASTPLSLVSPRRVKEIQLVKDWAEIGEAFSGTVQLEGEPLGNERLVINLWDRRGRELARQIIKPTTTKGAFSFGVPGHFPMLVTIRATLLNGEREIASAWRFARVVKRHRGQFNFVMWDAPSGNLAPWAEESLARTGVTVQLSGAPRPPDYVAAYDIAWLPYTIHISAQKDEQGIMKPCCWNDEERVQAWIENIVNKYIPARQHGVFAYSLGDEIAVRGACLSPHCLRAYQRYLQEQYGDIAALNASWGTNYARFADIQLSQPQDNEEAEALRAGNFPRWYDRQAFQSYNFCQLCERFGRAFRRIDPYSKCGFEGAGTFAAGDDIDGFVRSNDWWAPYPGTADEVLRSLAPRDFPRSNWMGYTKDADTLLEKYWRMITRGCDSVFWWRWEVIGRFHGWLAPNFDPYPANQEILRDTQIVREGLGDLLLHSQMQTDGIGIMYSQPSAYAAKIQASPSYGSYESQHTAFHQALRELGYNFRYFTDRQLRLGEIDLRQFRAIILPFTQAMSPQEAQQFREYVRLGGMLIADVRPAIYDGHVKPLGAGQLDDVFGIQRTGTGEARLREGQIGPLKYEKLRVDGDIQPVTAQALGTAGETPLWLIHKFGAGQAALLNFAMASYPALGAETTDEEAAVAFQALLARAGLKPAILLRNAQGQRLRNVEITRWTNGAVQIVSVFRHAGAAEPATMQLPEALYVYELKTRRAHGKKQNVSFPITPYRAQFFVLSPVPLAPAKIKAALPVIAPGSRQRLHLSSSLPEGQQAIKLVLKMPNGRLADWIRPVIVVDKRGVSVDVPVAFNDPRGVWTVNAVELYTGKASSLQFNVK